MNLVEIFARFFIDRVPTIVGIALPEKKLLNSSLSIRVQKSPFEGGFRGMAFGALTLIILLFYPPILFGQDFTQTIERSARFTNTNSLANELKVYNIQGDVTVKGYDGNEIRITARQKIEGSDEEVAQAREELEFVVDTEGDNIYVYIDAPFITINKKNNGIHYRIDDWDDRYEFIHDITVQVPNHTNVYASTINRGLVTVANTTQNVSASNVNGAIELTDIAGPTTAHTVNGDINIQYARSPSQNSDYQTVNGTIEVKYPDDLSADIRFKSMHGEFYTDFDNVTRLQSQVDTNKDNEHGSIRYKVNKFSPIRIGNGGPTFHFEVLNGDVYIKRIQS